MGSVLPPRAAVCRVRGEAKARTWMRPWLCWTREHSWCCDLHWFPYSKCPSWKTHFTVGGGGLMAVLPVLLSWGLFGLSPALEASLIDFC